METEKKTVEKEEGTAIDLSPKRIFIGNLPRRNIKESILKDFAKFGEFESYQFPRNSTGEMRKFCFINFKAPDSAVHAVKEMDKTHYFGHIINVQLASHQSLPNYHKDPKGRRHRRRKPNVCDFIRDVPFAREYLPPHHSLFPVETFHPSFPHFPAEYQNAYARLPMYVPNLPHALDAPRYSPPSISRHAPDEPRYSPPGYLPPRPPQTHSPLYSHLQIQIPSYSPPVIDLPPDARRYSLEAPLSASPTTKYLPFTPTTVTKKTAAEAASKKSTSIAELLEELMNKK
jgi:RNA recognition motif-containing protein